MSSEQVAARVSELLEGAHASTRSSTRAAVDTSDPSAASASSESGAPDLDGRDADPWDLEDPDDHATAAEKRAPRLLDRLLARVPMRLDPGRRSAAAVGAAVVVVAIAVGCWLYLRGPRSVALPAQPAPIAGAVSPSGTAPRSGAGRSDGSPRGTAPVSGASGTASEVVVDVAGKVMRPGLYRLRSGARIADAIAAAGGAKPGVDLTSINLAARVADGQQILVGVPGAVGAQPAVPASGSVGGAASTGGIVNLNTATLEQLETLPGIGPALGQRILDYRTEHGPFTAVDQLNDVSGIGDAKFAAIKAQVTV